jgi:hypothetical protein
MSESYCNWVSELRVNVYDRNERELLESFTVIGRAAEVPIPKVGETMRVLGPSEVEHAAKVVRVNFGGHTLLRRANPWTWKASWEISLRLPPS